MPDADTDSPIIFTGDQAPATLTRWVKEGRARRLAPGVYTTATAEPERVVAAHWRSIVAHEIPNAVIVDRSARAGRPIDMYLFVDGGPKGRTTPLNLPGLTIIPRRGPGPLEGDNPDASGIWFSSQPRALADNTRRTRARNGRPAATLTDDELADWIDHLAHQHGTDNLKAMRTAAERLADATGTASTINRMSELVGAAVGTRQVATSSQRLRSRQAGLPYDHRRAELFGVLAEHLRGTAPVPIPEASPERRLRLPFYEAYFSNFIEGTVLDLDDAEAVVYRGVTLEVQPEDGHDVAATFALVGDEGEMRRVPTSENEFETILLERHRSLMAARPEKHPGQFKAVGNRAGATVFVDPEMVRGTLRSGWDHIDSLNDPYQRAVTMMFVVAEVHPFDDGNGRLARVMMNAELSAANECRIVVPAVYRSEYLSALSALSNNARPGAIERVLGFAQRWTAQVDWSSRAVAERELTTTFALEDPGTALAEGIKLRLPSSVPAGEIR